MITKEMTATDSVPAVSSRELNSLNLAQVLEIDRALTDLGAFGEVRIVKSKNRVRFIEILESRDMLKIGSG